MLDSELCHGPSPNCTPATNGFVSVILYRYNALPLDEEPEIQMAILNEELVRSLLTTVLDPIAGRDIVSLGWLRGIAIVGQQLAVDLRAPYPIDGRLEQLQQEILVD